MEELLTPVSRTYRPSQKPEELLSLSQVADAPTTAPVKQLDFKGGSPEEALEVLKGQPGYDTLISVLKYLRDDAPDYHDFDIRKPNALASQIVHVLVTEIVPNYWLVLKDSSAGQTHGDVDILGVCLRSISGINATLAYLRASLREAKLRPKDFNKSQTYFTLEPIISLLALLLQTENSIQNIWHASGSACKEAERRVLRQELLSQLAGDKITSVCAEASDILRKNDKLKKEPWMANGKHYVEWLGQSLVRWANSDISEGDLALFAEIVSRALRLGYSDILVKKLVTGLLLQETRSQTVFQRLMDRLPSVAQRKFMSMVLRFISSAFPIFEDEDASTEDYPLIWAAVAALKAMVGADQARRGHLIHWLTSATAAGLGEPCGIRRAVVAVVAEDRDSIVSVLEKSMSQFGDQLYIQHSPILQQEAHAQVLLLAAGYAHRISPIKISLLLRSGSYMNTISNRLAASQNRARFLGMVVGEALSALEHKKDAKLDFKMDEMKSEDAEWYKSLTHVTDKAGPLDPLRTSLGASKTEPGPRPMPSATKSIPKQRNTARPTKPTLPTKTGFVIEEVDDDDDDDNEESEDDLIPYAKPDSDAEDSDDDPTLINRDKPKAPVYIRDLISYFRDTESYDKQKIALETAPALIRRKANFGTEVSSHAEELATLLIGLQDTFEIDDFYDLRQQGMLAVIVAQPKKMGQWFAKTFFDGDYSTSQRASILIVLGLGGRELAGFETSEYAEAASFPSKTLPAKTERYYRQQSSSSSRLGSTSSNLKALPPNAVDNLAQSLSQTFLAPLAAEAADAAAGPDALKLSSFTSRLENSQQQSAGGGGAGHTVTRHSKPRSGTRAIPNTTASLLSASFFFPLTARFQAVMRSASFAAGSSRSIVFDPALLSLYLKTLALLLHSAGPSTLSLPQMTAELWDLLLGVRGRCPGELAVTHAALFGLVALLDVNEADMRGLCERHGREVVETSEWVAGVFHGTRGGGDEGGGAAAAEEENEVKMLAAGVLIRLREAVDKYQALLMGNLIGVS